MRDVYVRPGVGLEILGGLQLVNASVYVCCVIMWVGCWCLHTGGSMSACAVCLNHRLQPLSTPQAPLPHPHTGETEEQYQRTEDLVRSIGFDRVNTAAYSPRPNTPAAEWEGQVADLIKADRLNRLNAVVTEVCGAPCVACACICRHLILYAGPCSS